MGYLISDASTTIKSQKQKTCISQNTKWYKWHKNEDSNAN